MGLSNQQLLKLVLRKEQQHRLLTLVLSILVCLQDQSWAPVTYSNVYIHIHTNKSVLECVKVVLMSWTYRRAQILQRDLACSVA